MTHLAEELVSAGVVDTLAGAQPMDEWCASDMRCTARTPVGTMGTDDVSGAIVVSQR